MGLGKIVKRALEGPEQSSSSVQSRAGDGTLKGRDARKQGQVCRHCVSRNGAGDSSNLCEHGRQYRSR